MDQSAVDSWLADFVQALREQFADRLIYVGHHGSWARGEATPNSDIDTTVVLERVEPSDLALYRDIVERMPDSASVASGILLSVAELQEWHRGELVQFFYGRKVLYGSIDAIVTKPGNQDLLADIRIKASSNLTAARHYLLYPHDRSAAVHRLVYPFKYCFYALQAWTMLQEGRYIERKEELLDSLADPIDREVVEVARDWHRTAQDRTERPLRYIELLERWSSRMLVRLASVESAQHEGVRRSRGPD